MTIITIFRQLRQSLADRLWLRPTIASLLAAMLAIVAAMIDLDASRLFGITISKDTLVNLLSMVATSMLTVATFSVAAIVTATTALSQATTPRITNLILADATIKNVLASFISAFIFSIVAIFAVEVLNYGSGGRVAVFFGLVAMIAWVLASFLRWVDHVTRIARVGTAMGMTSKAALYSVRADTVGTFGAAALDLDEPAHGMPVRAPQIGYVQSIDTRALHDFAEAHDATIRVAVRPGDLVDTIEPIAHVTIPGQPDEEDDVAAAVNRAVVIDDRRTHDYDPRFGLIILAETATRALSPGVNDPGTAIAVLTEHLRVFKQWADVVDAIRDEEPQYPRVAVPPLQVHDLVEAAFTVFVRDGADIVEVGLRLQRTLLALTRLDHPDLTREVRDVSALALELAEAAPLAKSQIEQLRAAAAKLQPPPPAGASAQASPEARVRSASRPA